MAKRRNLTTGQIAKYCGVNFRTVIRWIERGELKGWQLPGRGDNRVKVEDFLTFLQSNQMPIPDDLQEDSKRILIVEDDRNMLRAMERMLKKEGYDTIKAEDGFSAGALLMRYRPQVMTLDLQLPGLSGFKVLEFVRDTPEIKDVKILIVSGMEQKKLDEALSAGADGVLQKPFKNNELLAALKGLGQAALPSA